MAPKKDTAKKEIASKQGDLREEKMKALESALAQLNKTYGKGAVMKFGDAAADANLQVIPTGCLELDMALGVGGLPRGRVVEIYGPESSGKTTVALHCVAEAQKMGGVCAFIDAEHALDPVYARKLGVNVDELYISQPDTGEQALEICEALVRSGAIDMVVIDSVAALVPRAEIEGEMGDSFVGLQARLMSQALRKLTGVIAKTNAVAIFINQLREKVGVMYGNPETTTGGRALKFYASVRIDIRHVEITAERIHADCTAGDKNGIRNGNVSVPVRVAAEAGGQAFKIGNSAEIIGSVQFTVGIPAEEAPCEAFRFKSKLVVFDVNISGITVNSFPDDTVAENVDGCRSVAAGGLNNKAAGVGSVKVNLFKVGAA